MKGWLLNDCLTCIPGTLTIWHNLLEWLDGLEDKTNGHTDFGQLSSIIEQQLTNTKPDYIIRNATYFRRINTNIKTISLVQDVRENDGFQIDVINNSTIAVFNSLYVFEKYRKFIYNPNLLIAIIPLGINFSLFKPIEIRHPSVLPDSVLFIGASSNYPKGFHILLDIIAKMTDTNFCLIMKDDFSIDKLDESIRQRVRIFNRVNQATVNLIINSCSLAICTSLEETQHLSGIECGACNLPIVARPVGVYFDCKDDKEWGLISKDDDFPANIRFVKQNKHLFTPRDYFIKKYSTDICRQSWQAMVNDLKNI